MKARDDYRVNVPADDWSWAVGDGNLRMYRHGEAISGFYWTGEFIDPRGIVTVYRQYDLTRLDYVADGRCHSRSWPRYWSERTINRLARALVTDVLMETFGTGDRP